MRDISGKVGKLFLVLALLAGWLWLGEKVIQQISGNELYPQAQQAREI